MKAVHFGAGNIGRGFIGALLSEANYETVFVDVNDALIQEINQRGTYQVQLAGQDKTKEVSQVSGLNSANEEEEVIKAIANADLVTTAVGPNILKVIASLLAKGLMKRSEPINVIACENMVGGSEQLKQYVLDQLGDQEKTWVEQNVGFPNAAVDRIVPNQDQEDLLTVMVEPYFEWVVEASSIKGSRPDIAGITYVDDLTPYIERKLFTVNTGHAVAAYLGQFYGHQTIKQSIDDQVVRDKVQGALQESGAVLIEKYKFTEREHQQYIDTIIHRFENPDLSDEVTRVGRAPLRKLGAKDRLVRPALEYMNWTGKRPVYLAEVIAATLLYINESDPEAVELQSLIAKEGAIHAFQQVAELEPKHPLLDVVEERLHSLKR